MNKLTLAAVALAAAITSAATVPAAANTCTVTLDQYRSLKMGMTYAQAVAVLGCEGEEMSA
jgi:hypothetical protein